MAKENTAVIDSDRLESDEVKAMRRTDDVTALDTRMKGCQSDRLRIVKGYASVRVISSP
jgi:hypothetical protein